jgi:cyclophilin family peptidyl-prolyl cis-trans isomerase
MVAAASSAPRIVAADGDSFVDRNPKRARKKEARDERVAGLQAAYRRRRIARVAGVAVMLAAIVGLMLYVTQQRNDKTGSSPAVASKTPTPPPTPCPKVEQPKSEPRQYKAAPDPSLLKEGIDYSAVVKTSCGNIKMDLLEDSAPANVASFVFLSREGFFDGLTWHRIERNFVLQTGDPNGANGTPPDGPGYELPDELVGTEKKDYIYGTVGMANPGTPDSAGSQWFIIVHSPDKKEHAGLDPLYTIFAKVEKTSYKTLERISKQPVKGGSDPSTSAEPTVPVYIESIEILES